MFIENTKEEVKIGINEKYVDIFKMALIVSFVFWGCALCYDIVFIFVLVLLGRI